MRVANNVLFQKPILSGALFAKLIAYWVFFHAFLSAENCFRNTIRVSNSLDPDLTRYFVGPDLGPNCLQRLSVDKTRW